MEWIALAQDRVRRRALVNIVMILQVPQNVRNFVARRVPDGVSWMTPLHGVSLLREAYLQSQINSLSSLHITSSFSREIYNKFAINNINYSKFITLSNRYALRVIYICTSRCNDNGTGCDKFECGYGATARDDTDSVVNIDRNWLRANVCQHLLNPLWRADSFRDTQPGQIGVLHRNTL